MAIAREEWRRELVKLSPAVSVAGETAQFAEVVRVVSIDARGDSREVSKTITMLWGKGKEAVQATEDARDQERAAVRAYEDADRQKYADVLDAIDAGG